MPNLQSSYNKSDSTRVLKKLFHNERRYLREMRNGKFTVASAEKIGQILICAGKNKDPSITNEEVAGFIECLLKNNTDPKVTAELWPALIYYWDLSDLKLTSELPYKIQFFDVFNKPKNAQSTCFLASFILPGDITINNKTLKTPYSIVYTILFYDFPKETIGKFIGLANQKQPSSVLDYDTFQPDNSFKFIIDEIGVDPELMKAAYVKVDYLSYFRNIFNNVMQQQEPLPEYLANRIDTLIHKYKSDKDEYGFFGERRAQKLAMWNELKTLINDNHDKSLLECVQEMRQKYPDATKGYFSHETRDLLSKIEKTERPKSTLPVLKPSPKPSPKPLAPYRNVSL